MGRGSVSQTKGVWSNSRRWESERREWGQRLASRQRDRSPLDSALESIRGLGRGKGVMRAPRRLDGGGGRTRQLDACVRAQDNGVGEQWVARMQADASELGVALPILSDEGLHCA